MPKFDDKRWNKQYEKLVEFKRKHGNCLVPKMYQEDASLGPWVITQRHFHSKNIIRVDRKELLDQLGFVWRVYKSAPWNKQYEKLVEFKRENGHCLVPKRYHEDMSLGKWVDNQRGGHAKNELRLDRKVLLDEIGLVWRVDYSARWNKQYGKLVEFKRKTGHCMVPNRYQEDASLGVWVNTQRQFHANNKIRPDRKGLLDEIGFAWKAGTAAARSSTTNVRGLIIASFQALCRIFFSLARSCSAFNLCVC
jgi:hypothetical protein